MQTPINKPVTAGSIILPGAKLAVCIGVMVFVVSLLHQATRETIAGERKRVSEQLLYEVAGPGTTNLLEISPDHYQTRDGANHQGQIFKSITQNGYNGEITLWVGIDSQGQITGVRVIEHRETPGLGDQITLDVSDWILGFNGKSLHNPPEKYWKVKKDGGEFDQFTGATITPRALVNAVHDTLLANSATDTPSNE